MFDLFSCTKLRQATQMAVLNKIAFASSAEYGLLFQLKYKC